MWLGIYLAITVIFGLVKFSLFHFQIELIQGSRNGPAGKWKNYLQKKCLWPDLHGKWAGAGGARRWTGKGGDSSRAGKVKPDG